MRLGQLDRHLVRSTGRARGRGHGEAPRRKPGATCYPARGGLECGLLITCAMAHGCGIGRYVRRMLQFTLFQIPVPVSTPKPIAPTSTGKATAAMTATAPSSAVRNRRASLCRRGERLASPIASILLLIQVSRSRRHIVTRNRCILWVRCSRAFQWDDISRLPPADDSASRPSPGRSPSRGVLSPSGRMDIP